MPIILLFVNVLGVYGRQISFFTFYDLSYHNEEHHSLYRSPNIVRVIKSRRLRWAGHAARMEEGRSAFKMLRNKSTGKKPLGLGIDGRTILEWTLKRLGINVGELD